MSYRIVIPARYASSRLPGKPLLDIRGKPMVVRVWEAARMTRATEILVATDDARIVEAARRHGIDVEMTRSDHPSGTDRIAEVAVRRGWRDEDVVVNLQGDEPLLDPVLIDAVAEALTNDAQAPIATAAHPIGDVTEFFNPNVVKVVRDVRGRAIYFSRAPIPWDRDGFALSTAALPAGHGAMRHIGLYAYRVGFLRQYGQLAISPLERTESLEQLRVLWHGYPILVVESASLPAPGVDTPDDLERVRQRFDAVADSA